MRRLHRALDRVDQIATHGIEVDFIAEADGERVKGPRRVVPGPIKAPVDCILNLLPYRLEERALSPLFW